MDTKWQGNLDKAKKMALPNNSEGPGREKKKIYVKRRLGRGVEIEDLIKIKFTLQGL